MKKYRFFVGVDVSKRTLDVCLLLTETPTHYEHLQVPNNEKGHIKLIQWLTAKKLALSEGVVVLEHTGVYSLVVCLFLKKYAMDYSIIPGLVLKKSLGIIRGKNDKKDAYAIARYGYLYRDEIVANPIKEEYLLQLQMLNSQRRRMVTTLKSLLVPIKEMRTMGLQSMAERAEQNQQETITGLKMNIKEIDKQILALIDEDTLLKKQYELCTSIPGVGPQLTTYLLIVTHAFSRFNNSRELASFGGVAPFTYQSGTSVKGKNKTHPLADKQLKSLLHMSSLNAVRLDNQLRMYYERKNQEGKNAMLILNAVRNKILERIMATVKRGTPYVHLSQHLN